MPSIAEKTKNQRIKDATILREWYGNVPHAQHKIIRERILQTIMIKRRTWDSWLRGDSGIRPLHKKIINDIAGEQVFKIEKRS